MMRILKQLLSAICLLSLLTLISAAIPAQTRGNDPKAAVQQFFALLKAGKYAELHEYLPSEMQKRLSRDQLKQGLSRLDDFILIEKLEVGKTQQRGDFAVIDTTLFGRLKKPVAGNQTQTVSGKVIVQQYLFREGAQWKVATADSRTQAQFLKSHPEFSRGFQLTRPVFLIRQNGQWQAIK